MLPVQGARVQSLVRELGTIGHLLKAAAGQVQGEAGAVEHAGIFLLVEGVGRHGGNGAAADGVQGLHLEMVGINRTHNAVLGGTGLCAQSAALQNLAHMVGQTCIESFLDAHSSKAGGVIGTAGHNDIGTGFQGLHDGFVAWLNRLML